ncbi:hypothetical protein CC86DRAFT_409809 [Ophiobolus disseminans]|uniref:Heterokaryon incompatibility domain-containing protein n=1 Tax=Ophiobolus disseminans TaxID=1469910 RepID=A0A6A6ZRT1_9PLEO|nr:hypothetical protein CC86DRAFT_409809 [Ophiobolus disseminans]
MELPVSTATATTKTAPPTDNFYSPSNSAFYSHRPYQSLDKTCCTIRLLRVTKDANGELQCQLADGIPMTTAYDTYTAISYCAGDPKNTRSVLVNGLSFNAFANLAIAIEETYNHRSNDHGDVEAVLWADQICINQSDVTERSHQVGFMRDIYASARDVAVCLSTVEERGSLALYWIEGMYNNDRALREDRQPTLSAANRTFFNQQGKFDDDHIETKLNDAEFSEGLRDFWQMISQPWWERAWVYQEYAVARNTTFLYGGTSADGRYLMAVLLALLNDRATIVRIHKRMELYKHNYDSKRENHLQPSLGLEAFVKSVKIVLSVLSHDQSATEVLTFARLLVHSRMCAASDKRDHVYAFMGLAENSYGVTIDYCGENTCEAVFTQLTRQMIIHDGDLRALVYVGDIDHVRSAHLPSWVPDWSSNACYSTLRTMSMKFLESEARRLGWQPHTTFSQNGNVLQVSGIRLDIFHQGSIQVWESCSIIARTAQGRKVHLSSQICINDELWYLLGAYAPFILRPDGSHYELVYSNIFYEAATQCEDWKEKYVAAMQEPPVRISIK